MLSADLLVVSEIDSLYVPVELCVTLAVDSLKLLVLVSLAVGVELIVCEIFAEGVIETDALVAVLLTVRLVADPLKLSVLVSLIVGVVVAVLVLFAVDVAETDALCVAVWLCVTLLTDLLRVPVFVSFVAVPLVVSLSVWD